MSFNRGASSNVALFMLGIALISGIVGLATDYWYYWYKKVDAIGGLLEVKTKQHTGLWKMCTTVYGIGGIIDTETCLKYGDVESLLQISQLDKIVDLPEYYKYIRYMMIGSAVSGSVAIFFWIAYKGSSSPGTVSVLKVLSFLAALGAGVLHTISVIVWVANKQKEETVSIQISDALTDISCYWWSFGAVCFAALLELLSIIPILTSNKEGFSHGGRILVHPTP